MGCFCGNYSGSVASQCDYLWGVELVTAHPKSYLFGMPYIIPMSDEFVIGKPEDKNGVIFVTVRNRFPKGDNEAIAFIEGELGGHWLMPVSNVGGIAWRINPQIDPETREYVWLLVKAGK